MYAVQGISIVLFLQQRIIHTKQIDDIDDLLKLSCPSRHVKAVAGGHVHGAWAVGRRPCGTRLARVGRRARGPPRDQAGRPHGRAVCGVLASKHTVFTS